MKNKFFSIAVTLLLGVMSVSAQIRITTTALPDGTVGVPYSESLLASGSARLTWSITAGALPNGLNLTSSGNITGTPTTAGTFTFTVRAVYNTTSATKQFSITINQPNAQTWQIGSPNVADVKATLSDGTLTISGTGAMQDFTSGTAAPWYSLRTTITSLQITNGVTSIGYFAFADCSSLTSVTISNTVASIRNSSFPGCSSLASIIIPSSVTSLGSWVFSYCSSLTSITCLSTNPSAITMGTSVFDTVDKNACVLYVPTSSVSAYQAAAQWKDFTHIQGFQSWDIGSPNAADVKATLSGGTLTISGTGAMQDFPRFNAPWYSVRYSITSLQILFGVTTVSDYAFEDCSSITSSLTIPNSVISIGHGVFEACGLTTVTILGSLTSIGDAAFYGCSALTAFNVDAANPNYISDNGVLFNKSKTSLVCYPGGKSDGNYVIPASVSSIGIFAFEGSNSLTSISIPSSVTSIGGMAFRYCRGLTSITCLNTNPANITLGGSVFEGVNTTTCVLNVPAGSASLYQAADQWKDFTHINVVTGIKTIEAPDVNVYSQAGNVIVESKTLAIKTVFVYNLSGQLLKTVESGSNHVSIPLSFSSSIIIAKVVMMDGTIETRKIVNR